MRVPAPAEDCATAGGGGFLLGSSLAVAGGAVGALAIQAHTFTLLLLLHEASWPRAATWTFDGHGCS